MAEAAPAPSHAEDLVKAPFNGSTNGAPASDAESETPTFVAANPRSEGHRLSNFLLHGHPTRIDANFSLDLLKLPWLPLVSMFCVKILRLVFMLCVKILRLVSMFWVKILPHVSMIIVKFLWAIYPGLKLIGFLIEWTINFIILNGGFFRLVIAILLPCKWRHIVFPSWEDDDYLSIVGQMDPRTALYVNTSQYAKDHSTQTDAKVFPVENVGLRATADVCVMAAKLAYENKARVTRVVEQIWKMNFVEFYSCWNDFQKMDNTQAFIFTDKAHDANAVVVAFRGTEPFNAYDWSTDFDFTRRLLPELGGVHIGFMEALGLVNRKDTKTLTKFLKLAQKSKRKNTESVSGLRKHIIQSSGHRLAYDDITHSQSVSGLAEHIIHKRDRKLAYDAITERVALLLIKNPKAKLFITGHSLGGALAALYAIMLYYTGRTDIADRIGAVYTFGQPRVGGKRAAKYASEKLKGTFFRVVYCNDMVPRIPFNNCLCGFKHFGDCIYFNSVYKGYVLQEESNPNFFSPRCMATMHPNALWEIFQAMILITRYGADFSESVVSLVVRVAGLVFPGMSSHSLCNYVNSVRLTPSKFRRMPDDLPEITLEFSLCKENIKDILDAVTSDTQEGSLLFQEFQGDHVLIDQSPQCNAIA